MHKLHLRFRELQLLPACSLLHITLGEPLGP
jgi:hypothetical protein